MGVCGAVTEVVCGRVGVKVGVGVWRMGLDGDHVGVKQRSMQPRTT